MKADVERCATTTDEQAAEAILTFLAVAALAKMDAPGLTKIVTRMVGDLRAGERLKIEREQNAAKGRAVAEQLAGAGALSGEE